MISCCRHLIKLVRLHDIPTAAVYLLANKRNAAAKRNYTRSSYATIRLQIHGSRELQYNGTMSAIGVSTLISSKTILAEKLAVIRNFSTNYRFPENERQISK